MSMHSFLKTSLADAVRDGKSNDASTYNAITSLSAYIASRFVDSVQTRENKDGDGDGALDIKRFSAMWKAYLEKYAYLGGIVWEGSDEAAQNVHALPAGDRRAAAAKDYITKKPKGARLVTTLAARRTYVKRLVEDTLVNHAGIFRDILAHAQSGGDAEALAGLWQAHVEYNYGATLSALTAALPGNASANPPKSELEKVMDRAKNWDLATLEEIVQKLIDKRDSLRDDIAGIGDMGEMEIQHIATPSTDTTTGRVIKQRVRKAA